MAKSCTFETYLSNGDPYWCCSEKSTTKVSMDVVNDVNEHWQELVVRGKEHLWVVYEDLCDTHAKLAQEVHDNEQKLKEEEGEMHVQVDQT